MLMEWSEGATVGGVIEGLPIADCQVAIVDDHPMVVNALAQELTAVPGVEVVFTGSTVDDLLHAWPNPTVVLLDLDLGNRQVSASDVARILDLQARVLIVSAVANLVLVRQLLECGAAGAVSKAEDISEVVSAVAAVSRGADYTSPLVMAALATAPDTDRPALSEQEKRVMVLYASGMKITAVARRLDISPHTVKDYLRRIRVKFHGVGRHAPTQVHLYQEAVRLGYMDES